MSATTTAKPRPLRLNQRAMLIPEARFAEWHRCASAMPGLSELERQILDAIMGYYRLLYERGYYAGFQIMPISVPPSRTRWPPARLRRHNQRDSRKITDRPVAVIRDFTHYGAREPWATHWHCR